MHTGEEVLAYFECLGTDGLTEEEVAGRRLRFGRNEIPSEEGVPFWKLVLKQARGIRHRTVTVFAVGGEHGMGLAEERCVGRCPSTFVATPAPAVTDDVVRVRACGRRHGAVRRSIGEDLDSVCHHLLPAGDI
jgi:magnesium-transporting ATPase (P-type)